MRKPFTLTLDFIEASKLRSHEKTSEKRMNRIAEEINQDNSIVPILVDSSFLVVLDGHHRLNYLKKLGFKKIPVLLTDYFSDKLTLFPRRKKIKLNKRKVIENAFSNRLFQFKTTRHSIKGNYLIKVPLNFIKRN
ncbi:MAG: ParB N-terminal domain-containing protein [archaeon]